MNRGTWILFRRFVRAIFLLFLVSLVSFGFLRCMPGDFAEVLFMEQMGADTMPTPEALDAFKARNGFDRPLHIQYLSWLRMAVRGDLGYSFRTEDRVGNELRLRLINSLKLGLSSMVTALAVALPIGIIGAVRPGTWQDQGGLILAVLGMSIPKFWFALLLILLFSLHLHLLPVAGSEKWTHLILPSTAIGFSLAGIISRFVRGCLLDVMNSDFIRTARAKGVPEWRVVMIHAFKNALIPIITLLGLQLGRLFDSVVVIETVFAWPGVGRLMVTAILGRDYPVIQGCVLLVGLVYVIINLAVDGLVLIVDPTVKAAL